MPGYISQWWDSVTKKYKEVSKEDPFPVTMVGGGTGGAEEVEVTHPLPAGTNNIGKVDVATLPAIPAGSNNIGNVGITGGSVGLLGGANNIGNVGITGSLPDTNEDGTALPGLARTATTNSADLTNAHGKGVGVILNVTAISGSPSVTLKIQGKDPASGEYYDILASSAVTAIGTTVLKVYPSLTAVANSVANDILPRTWRVVVEHTNGDSIQYSVGYSIV